MSRGEVDLVDPAVLSMTRVGDLFVQPWSGNRWRVYSLHYVGLRVVAASAKRGDRRIHLVLEDGDAR